MAGCIVDRKVRVGPKKDQTKMYANKLACLSIRFFLALADRIFLVWNTSRCDALAGKGGQKF